MLENSNDSNTDWTQQPPPEFQEEAAHETQSTWNPNDMDENQQTGIQKFMNMSIVAHDDVAKEIKYQITEGNIDPIQAFVALKRVGKINELCLDSQKGDKELREIILNNVRKTLDGGKSLDIYGANLRIQDTGTYYDYNECGHKGLLEAYKIKEQIEVYIKKVETEIKALLPSDNNKTLGIRSKKIIEKGIPVLSWSEDEFENTIFPPIKKGGESVICTFKKNKE